MAEMPKLLGVGAKTSSAGIVSDENGRRSKMDKVIMKRQMHE
jgi:hypothetical protein